MGVTRVLLVEDSLGDARLVREMFREQTSHEIELTHVECMSDAETHLADKGVDLIMLDLGLPDERGIQAVRRAHAAAPKIPLMVFTGTEDDVLAVQALHEGAQDYLVKGQIDARNLMRCLRYAIEHKGMKEALLREKERAQVTLGCIGDGVICTNVAGNITFLNLAAETMTGWCLRAAAGQPLLDVLQMLDTTKEITQPLRSRLGQLPTNCTLVRRDGSELPIENSIAPIHDHQGQSLGAVIVFRDVSEARATSLQMAHSAQHDHLTGLPNRMLLKERVTRAISAAQRYQRHVAVLYLDLDGFKHINDSLGHPLGDKLLQSVTARLLNCARTSDTVSRHGGDEFIVLLSEVQHPEDAAVAARRMLDAIAEPHTIDSQELHVTTSVGVSIFPEDGDEAETLIKNADTAMYQAKENGRHSYQYFRPAMNARAVERQFIEENLRRALERNEFTLHYQPKIDFKTGAIVGAEALIRWTHPTRGLVSPAEFIPVAEDSGLIKRIGSWVLNEACEQAQAWTDAGLPETTMAVNVSAIEFRNDNFLDGLFATLGSTGFDPKRLEIELTESALMKHPETVSTILHTVREAGIHVAVDDFGTGYSSLSYLQKFPVDALKIDQSFVAQITPNGENTGIVTAVISMAQSLKLRVVAEGVETLEQLEFLRAHRCDEAQGFYFSKAVVPEQFAFLLATQSHEPFVAAA